MWSVGAFTAAAFTDWMMEENRTMQEHYFLIAIVMIILILPLFLSLVKDPEQSSENQKIFAWPTKGLLLLGLICFCGAMSEGTMADWSSLYYRQIINQPHVVSALGYTPVNKAGDTVSGNLTVTGTISTGYLNLINNDFPTKSLWVDADTGNFTKRLILDLETGTTDNTTLGMYLQSIKFSAPTTQARNLLFNVLENEPNTQVDILKSGTMPVVSAGVANFYNATIAANVFSSPVADSFTFLAGANFSGNLSAANGTFITLSAQSLNVNNLFTVDSSGSVFNNSVTFNDTIEFNAIGDLAIANDLVFTNTAISKIRSATDLTFEVGEPFNSNNFVVNTYNSGKVLLNGPLVVSGPGTFAGNLIVTGTLSTNTLWVGNGASVFTSDDVLTIKNNNGVDFIGNSASQYTFFENNSVEIFKLNGENNSLAGNLFLSGNLNAAAGTFTTGDFSGNVTMASAIITGNFTAASGNITGNLTLGSAVLTGLIRGTTGNFSGNVTMASARITGNFTAASGRVTGTLSAQNLLMTAAPAVGATTVCRTAGGLLGACSSSLTYKENVQDFTLGLATIVQLRPISFDWKSGSGSDFGFIAEEINAINPLFAELDASGNVTGVKYTQITALLTKGIQEQQAQITALSTAQAGVNFSQATSMYDSLMNAIDNLSMSTDNGNLVFNSDIVVNGKAILSETTFTGDVSMGQMKFDTLNNDLSVLGASCVRNDGSLDDNLCQTQSLFIMKSKAGNVNIFDGKVVLKPNGDMQVEKINASEVNAAEYKVTSTSEVSGTATLTSNQSEITINSTKVKSNSKIFITASSSLNGKSLFVDTKTEESSFKVKINEAINSDVTFDWFILNVE
jgi:cytoskeletal protein CcmA (bactofilin family)